MFHRSKAAERDDGYTNDWRAFMIDGAAEATDIVCSLIKRQLLTSVSVCVPRAVKLLFSNLLASANGSVGGIRAGGGNGSPPPSPLPPMLLLLIARS